MGIFLSFGRGTTRTLTLASRLIIALITKIGLRYAITLFIVLTIFTHAIFASIAIYRETGDIKASLSPLIWELGGRIANADEYNYQLIQQYTLNPQSIVPENKGGITELISNRSTKLYVIFELLSGIWFIYMFWWIFYKIYEGFNESAAWRNRAWALLTLAILQIAFISSLLISQGGLAFDPAATPQEKFTQSVQHIIPFKGTIATIIFFANINELIYDKYVPPQTQETT